MHLPTSKLVRSASLLCASLSLFSASAPGQSFGNGGETLLYQFDGQVSGDQFGTSVSSAGDVNGDGHDDLIIGALKANGDGSASVYSGVNGSLLIQWNGLSAGDGFGNSVSTAGDLNGDGYDDVIVGAPFADPGGLDSAGSAYAYSGLNGGLLYQWMGTSFRGQFGHSVSDAGDVNGDGFDDVIIGAFTADPNGLTYNPGSAFVYSGANGSLLYQWDGSSAHDHFGISVSGVGDVNGDGSDDLIVGASLAGSGVLNNPGSVYLYSGSDGALLFQWRGTKTEQRLGFSVSDAGDVDGDGTPDIIAGSNSAGFHPDSAQVYSGIDGSLLYDFFGTGGSSVSGAGDVNNDGFDDFILGAWSSSAGGVPSAGSAYIYSGADGSLFHRTDGEAIIDYFGSSVSGAGDVNADGFDDVIVGAPGANPGGRFEAGSAFVYSINNFLRASTATVSAYYGGVVQYGLNFPESAALYNYKILISESGVGPTHYGVNIPLTQDGLMIDTFFGYYPVPTYSDLRGTLDANGMASASLTVPARISSSLFGNIYYFAAIANPSGQLPEYSSLAIPLTITF